MNSSIEGLVSVIMPTYNSSAFLRESVESVLAQTYLNWELLIVDDCSRDDTVEIAQKFAELDSRIKVRHLQVNGGPATARNVAIEAAGGQYIAFLDSDDLWMPNKLQHQLDEMKSKNACFCFSSYIPFQSGGAPKPPVVAPASISYKRMLKGSVIGCLTVIYDAAVIQKRYFSDGQDRLAGTIYSRYVSKIGHEDYVLWLQIIKDCELGRFGGAGLIGVEKPLAYYRLHDQSFSTNKKKVALYQWIIYRRCERLGLLKSLYYFLWYAVNGVLKHR